MAGVILAFLISTNLIAIQAPFPHEKCYEIINGNGKRFPLYWAARMSEIPEYIYVECDVMELEGSKKYPTKFDAKLVDGLCTDSAFVVPNLLTKTGQKQRFSFKIFHGHGDFRLDHAAVDLEYDFPAQGDTLLGLSKTMMLPVSFDPNVKTLQRFQLSDHSYYQKMPDLKSHEAYCLRSVAEKDSFVVRISGSQLKENGAYDHYLLKIRAYADDVSEGMATFLVKTFVCDTETKFRPVNVYTDQNVKKITVEATDGQGTQQLSAVYSGIKFHFYLDGESSNFEPDTIDIKREDVEHAALQEGAILMYQTKKSRTWCKKVDKNSFVDTKEVGETIVQISSFMRDHSGSSNKIVKIKPGSDSEISDCVQDS